MTKMNKSKSLHKGNKSVDVSDISKVAEEEFEEANIRRIPPEEKYVRRTAEDFKAGAEPVRGSGSHRFVRPKVTITPELNEAAKAAAKSADVAYTVWIRAAIRKALRQGLDVDHELSSEIILSDQSDKASPSK